MSDEYDEQDRIQRALNAAKKRELEERYGAHFSEPNPDLPPDIEAQWLHNIEEFERQFEHAKRIKVREYVGNPQFKSLEEIPPDQRERELDSILEYLDLHGVVVDFLCDVPVEDAYRFVTVELMEEETDDVRMEGMRKHFCYEDFHPNAEYDAKTSAEHFLWDLFERHTEYVLRGFAEDEMYDQDGSPMSHDQLNRMLQQFYKRYSLITSHNETILDCTVEGDYATVRVQTEWRGLDAAADHYITHSGVSVLRLKKSPYNGYDVIQANVVGWEKEF